jgi:hypothetical protein
LHAPAAAGAAEPAMARTLTYTRHMSPSDHRVREQTKNVLSGRTTRPFTASAGPSFFAAMGYMVETGPNRIFNAPDADVLIDQSFAATHCFHLRRGDSAHLGQVGLAFTPIGGRDTLVDVDGVIWVDAKTPQLRSLDFTYTSLEPAAMQANAGGHIEFQTMPNGVSFISRWNLLLASLDVPPNGVHRNVATVAKPRRTDLSELTLKELVDAGGLVLHATWPDGTDFVNPLATISGVVVGKGAGLPAAGAIVTLAGTSDSAITDASGRFRIQTLAGTYLLEARDTTLSAFVEPRSQSSVVELRDGAEATARLEVTPIERALGDICRDQPMRPGSGLIVGYVGANGAKLPGDAYVEATFQHIETATFTTTTQKSSMDEHGRFMVCGTPKDRKVELRLKASTRTIADTTVIVERGELTHKVLWLVTP